MKIYDHISRWFLLRMRNISDKSCTENQMHFTFSNFSLSKVAYEIMWKNTVQPDRPQMTIWRMRLAHWIAKATNTHSEYVTSIAFPWQQALCERASVLRLYIHLPVLFQYGSRIQLILWRRWSKWRRKFITHTEHNHRSYETARWCFIETYVRIIRNIYIKQNNPITGLDKPWGLHEFEAPRFQDNRHTKVARLSALRTGRLYPPADTPGTHFYYRLSQLQGYSAAGKFMSVKNSNDTPRPSGL